MPELFGFRQLIRVVLGPPLHHAFLTRLGLEIFARFIGVAQPLTGLLPPSKRFARLGAVPPEILLRAGTAGWQVVAHK